MLRKRIIPIVLLDGFSVLKTTNFDQRRNLGSPITVIETYNTRNIDELILLDIDASKQNRAIDKFVITEIAKGCFMPLAVGGGIKSLKDIEGLLQCGADKIIINTSAIENKDFISKAAKVYGSQCIVVSIDVIKIEDEYAVFSKGRVLTELKLFNWVLEVEKMGAGEIIINNVSLDGTMKGPDIILSEKIAMLVTIPVVYAGGVSSTEDVVDIARTRISAIGISSIFHFTNITPKDCSDALKKVGIPAR
jgi:cyclase